MNSNLSMLKLFLQVREGVILSVLVPPFNWVPNAKLLMRGSVLPEIFYLGSIQILNALGLYEFQEGILELRALLPRVGPKFGLLPISNFPKAVTGDQISIG